MKNLAGLKGLLIISGTLFLNSCAVYPPGYQSALPVDDVVKMSKSGVSSKDIIRQMRQSHSVYRLSASELAQLSRQGVRDSVINYMERTRINEIRRNYMYNDPYYSFGGIWGYPWYGY